MSFETISLLLNWMEMGALLAILFRSFQHLRADRQYAARAEASDPSRASRRGADIANSVHGPGVALRFPVAAGAVPTPRAWGVPTIWPAHCREVRAA